MELVTVRGATKRTTPPRSLTTDEFHKFAEQLWEPFKTIALVCLCFGLRISECLGLRWSDINWLGGTLCVERGIVRQRVDETKTTGSRRIIPADAVILDVLKRWRQMTEFSADADWVFASPAQLGRLPWSYPRVLQVFQKAAAAAGVGRVSTHTMRHSFRSWLDAAGASLAAQKTLMRHASISTTMDIYGGQTATPEMSRVSGKVAGLAVNGLHADCKPI
jgi:integrase